MGAGSRYAHLMHEVEKEAQAAGRGVSEVMVVAVSKTVGTEAVADALRGGAHDFGENRPDGLIEKQAAFPQENWHFIGNIQSRRIGDIVGRACLVHSLFQKGHVARIDAAAGAQGIVQDVLLEVNVSGEASKGGLAVGDAASMLELCLTYPQVRVCGLMTMAPQGDLRYARECFGRLRSLRDTLRDTYGRGCSQAFMHDLSMGMSQDWREGIAEGATIVRIGRAVFDDEF